MTRRHRSIAVGLTAAAILMVVVVWLWCRGPRLYTVTILPSLGGGEIHACALNDRGQVVGVEHLNRNKHLVLWDREKGVQDLGPVPAEPLTMNNAGQIAGTLMDPNGRTQAFLWEPGAGRTIPGPLGGRRSAALSMNDCGQIVGVSDSATRLSQCFLWHRSTGTKELPMLERCECWPMSINDRGQILMLSRDGAAKCNRWHLFDANGPRSLDVLPADVWPAMMNNHGSMAGVLSPGGKQPCLILRNERGLLKRLFAVSPHTFITRLNDKNQIACTSFTRVLWAQWLSRLLGPRLTVNRATSCLWDPVRGRVSLNRYMRNAERFVVADLNNNGAVVGTVTTKNGQRQVVLLEPIPERWGR